MSANALSLFRLCMLWMSSLMFLLMCLWVRSSIFVEVL